MVAQLVKITNPTGLDVKPAGSLCREAMKFKSKVTYSYGSGNTANAKSVLSVLGAGVQPGDELEITCEGVDEAEALAAMVELFESGME